MAQLDAGHHTFTSETRALVPNCEHQRRFSRATGCVKKKKKSVRARGACLPSGRVCFLSVTKPRLPESVKELRYSPPPIHHLRNRIIAISRVRSEPLQGSGCRMIPPSDSPDIQNKNLKGGTCETVKVLIVILIGVNSVSGVRNLR